MALFKVTFIFQGEGRGWTESYILEGTGDNHVNQVEEVEKLAAKRARLLTDPCFIKGYRISLEGVGPDALLSYNQFKPEKLELPGGEVIALGGAADPDQALLIRCSNNTQSKHRFIYLRGIPDNIEVLFGKYAKNNVWGLLMLGFKNVLTGGHWGWMGVDDANSKKKIKVNTVVENANGTTTFTFDDNIFPVGLAAGSLVKVRISGVNKKSPANGVHIVRAQATTVATTENALAPGKYHFGGKGSYTPLKFYAIEKFEDQKIVTRETGAPLLESPGRQQARARG